MSDPCELSGLVADLREIAGNHDGEQATANKAADAMLRQADLLLRCYRSFHRASWEEGETESEVMEAVHDHLCNVFGNGWLDSPARTATQGEEQ